MAEMKKKFTLSKYDCQLKNENEATEKAILPSTLSKYEIKLNSKGNVYKPFAFVPVTSNLYSIHVFWSKVRKDGKKKLFAKEYCTFRNQRVVNLRILLRQMFQNLNVARWEITWLEKVFLIGLFHTKENLFIIWIRYMKILSGLGPGYILRYLVQNWNRKTELLEGKENVRNIWGQLPCSV